MKSIAAVLVSTLVFGGAVAQASDPSPSPHASAATSGTAMANSDAKRDAAVEKHIGQLHATLKITPVQEVQWNEVAATMRENAKDMDRQAQRKRPDRDGDRRFESLCGHRTDSREWRQEARHYLLQLVFRIVRRPEEGSR